MRRGRALSAVAGVLVSAGLVACSGSPRTPAPTTAAPTPIAKLDLSRIRVARAHFCDRVPDAAVRAALGGKAQADDSWGNGDPVPDGGGSGAVGHEIGCGWSGAGGTAARAWVFARPIAADFAGSLVAKAGKQQGCTGAAAPVFGSPALLQTCTGTDGVERVRRAGLFGDAWLTCEVAGSAGTHPRARLDPWCAAVVAALDVG
jgi:hypothetical protein